MKTMGSISIAVLLAISALNPAIAAGKGHGKGADKDDHRGQGNEGTVTAVNVRARSISIQMHYRNEHRTETFPVDSQAKIKVDGKDATLADVKPGMHASVTMTSKGMIKTAQNINAHSAKENRTEGKEKDKDKDKDKDKHEGGPESKGKGKHK